MKIYRFDAEIGNPIKQYDSINVIFSRITFITDDAWVSVMHLGENGVVGYHQATIPQLFLVVEGDGWVRGEIPERHSIKAGQAAFWEKGEFHESGTNTGMTALIVEVKNENFDPSEYLREV